MRRECDRVEEGGGCRDVFEGLVKTFAVFRSRPRPISFHGKCVQCAGAPNWLLVRSCPHRKRARRNGREDTEETAMYPRARHVLSVVELVGEYGWAGPAGFWGDGHGVSSRGGCWGEES